jgi:hypothetical protein
MKARGVPVGRLHEDPRLAEMTLEERHRYLADFLEHGPPPAGPVRDEAPPSVSAPAAGGFQRTPLSLGDRSERYPLPNCQTLWVHPCSVDDKIFINCRSVEDTAKTRQLGDEPTAFAARAVQMETIIRAQVYQVVACCRQGAEPTSAPFFQPADAEYLRREPGYINAIEEICAISDSLTAGRSESAALKEAMAYFFSRTQRWAETWCSRLATGSSESSLPEFLANLEDFGRSASALSQPSGCFPGSLAVLSAVLSTGEDDLCPP